MLLEQTIEIAQGAPIQIVERVTKLDGSPLLAGDVTTGDIRVFDRTSSTEEAVIYALTALNAAGIGMQGALTKDGYWTRDGEGYTLRNTMESRAFNAQSGKDYRVEITLYGAAGREYKVNRLVRVGAQYTG